MERAVLLSDIEFLPEVHSSDWERIEEYSFLVEASNSLNENQQIVLEWLQAYSDKDSGDRPIQSIWYFLDLAGTNRLGIDSTEAFLALSRDEQFQVLAAFADWGMKNG